MAPRNIFHASPLPEFHNIRLLNPPSANPQRHIESTMLGSNEHTINYHVNFPHPNTANSEAIVDNYQHPVFTVSTNQNMRYQTQNVPYCYNQHANQTGATMAYPPAENSRMAFKRKTPAHPVHEDPFGHQFTASSSNFPVLPNHFQRKPMPVCSRPLPSNGSVSRYQDETPLFVGDEYQRNVRIRHNNAPQAELNPAWQPSSSRSAQLFHSSASFPASTGGQWRHTSQAGTYSQWNHPTRNHVIGCPTEHNSAWNSDNSRNLYARAPNPQGSDAQGTWAGPTRYDQRQALNWISSNYTNGSAGARSVSSSRIPRPTNLQNSSSNRALRSCNPGWPTFRSGWTSQGLSMMDVSYSAYELDLFDEHRDMRLNIDSMSYEELLMLEETIGSVNTGLSEDHLSRCLTEIMYCSSASDEDDASCPICLEEFKDKDSQGVMKCQHVYHTACIKKWLGLKKTCPVCKAPALDADVKQKQKVSL